MRKFLVFLLALCFLALPVQADVRVQFVGTTFNIFTGVQAASFSGSGTTYILSVPPNETVTFYLTNTNGALSDSITVQGFSTGSPLISDYSNHTGLWVPVSIYNSATGTYTNAAQTLTLSTAAGQVASLYFPQATAGQIALKISSGSGTGPLNLDIVASMNGQLPSTFVQGLGSVGNAAVGNPVFVGGVAVNQSQIITPLPTVSNVAVTDFGLNLGGHVGVTSTANGPRLFGNTPNETIGVSPYGYDSIRNTWDESGALASPSAAGVTPEGSLFITNGGVQFQILSTISTSIVQNLTSNAPGVHPSCTFLLKTTSGVTGTNPTLDVYIQDSSDNATWNDRIHFQQMTATTNLTQIAAIASGQIAVGAPVTASIAAGTIVSGSLAPFIRAQFVVGGTSPSFPLSLTVDCQ